MDNISMTNIVTIISCLLPIAYWLHLMRSSTELARWEWGRMQRLPGSGQGGDELDGHKQILDKVLTKEYKRNPQQTKQK